MSRYPVSDQYQNHKVVGDSDLVPDNDYYCSIDQMRNRALPGDILEFLRGTVTHFALYLGNGKVMFIDIEDERANDAQVQEGSLLDVCEEVKVRVSNSENVARAQFQLDAKPTAEILGAALSFRNRVVPYERDFRNCEYYSTLWRYGRGFSTQVAENATARANFFESDGYAKYKQLETSEQSAFSTDQTRSNFYLSI